MEAKFADVLPVEEVVKYLEGIDSIQFFFQFFTIIGFRVRIDRNQWESLPFALEFWALAAV